MTHGRLNTKMRLAPQPLARYRARNLPRIGTAYRDCAEARIPRRFRRRVHEGQRPAAYRNPHRNGLTEELSPSSRLRIRRRTDGPNLRADRRAAIPRRLISSSVFAPENALLFLPRARIACAGRRSIVGAQG